MKDKDIIQKLQKKKELDKTRGILQQKLEREHDEGTIIRTLKRIRSIDRERYLLFKIGEGAAL